MQKDIIVKISSILQHQKIPERIRIRLENHFFPTGNSKKFIFPNRKPFKNRKIEQKIRNFSKIFLMKVSGKPHSAENPNEAFMLAKLFVSSEN